MSGDEFNPRPSAEPTEDLLLAQALETCLRAERVIPGSSEAIVARVPASARAELIRLLEVARALEVSAARGVPSPEFREAARERLMRRISGMPEERTQPVVLSAVARQPRRASGRRWLLRGVGGLVAAGLTAAATLTASASALPGEPLYPVKQVREEVALRMAADDQARAMALLLRANARLDETTRLLEQGRTADAVQTAQQYDDSVDQATTALVTALGPEPLESPAAQPFASELKAQQAQIETVLPEAPEPAQAELREALAVTQRSRTVAANPEPVEVALNPTVQLPAALPRVEAEPTRVPTATPLPPVAVAEPTATREPEPEVARVAEDRSGNVKEDRGGAAGDQGRGGPGPSSDGNSQSGNRGGPAPQVARPQVSRPVVVAPPPASSQSGRGVGGDQRGGSDDGATANQGRRGEAEAEGQAEVEQPQQPVVNAVAPAAVVPTRGQGGGDDGGNRGGGSGTTSVQAQSSGVQAGGTSGNGGQGRGDGDGASVSTAGGGQANTDGGGRGDQGGNRASAAPTPVPTTNRGGGDRDNNASQVQRPVPTATPVRQQQNGSGSGNNTTNQQQQQQQQNNRSAPQPAQQSGNRGGGGDSGNGRSR